MAIELLDEETQKLVDRIEKMLRLAANNPNENERKAAEAKAMQWLHDYNIDMATVEQHGGTENGRRADENLKGGHYEYQRDLWRAVAELNFCMYFNIVARIESVEFMPNRRANQFRKHKVVKHERQHRLVGRVHNIILTRTMCEYMEQAIERQVSKQCQDEGVDQLRGVWANSFRRGAFERVSERIVERKHELIAEDKRKQYEADKAAREKGAEGVSTSKALGFVTLREEERDRNRDFLMGEDGYSAKMRAEAAADQQRRAEARAAAEAEAVQWAKDHPEEVAAEERQARQRERRLQQQRDYYWQTRGQYSSRGYGGDSFKGDRGGYYAGRKAGNDISIDPQTAGRRNAGALS